MQFKTAVLFCFLAVQAVQAAIIPYSNRSVWLNVVDLTANIEFNGPPVGGSASYSNSTGYFSNGALFIGHSYATYSLVIVNASAGQPYYNWGSGAVIRGADWNPTARIRVTLPTGVTAFGSDIMLGGSGGDFSIQIDNGPAFGAATFANPTRAFFGITSDTPISFIDFRWPSGTYPLLDNFAFGATQETPEAATLILCASGLIFLARRKRKHATLGVSEWHSRPIGPRVAQAVAPTI